MNERTKYPADLHARLLALGEDRATYADQFVETLYIDGTPYRFSGLSVEAGDGAAVQLTCTVRDEIDESMWGSEVRLSVDAASGDVFDAYIGRLVFTSETVIGVEIEAQTPAYEWARTPLGQNTEWLNAPANTVLYSALSALSGLYRGIEIPKSVANPPVTAMGDSEMFGRYDTIADVVDAVEGDEESSVRVVVDTALSVANAYPTGIPTGETVYEIEEGRDCDFGEVAVETPDRERVYAIEVYHQTPDGSDEQLARVLVDNGDAQVSPASVFAIEYDPQGENETAEEMTEKRRSAQEVCFTEAMRRGQRMRTLDVPLRYRPYMLERGDLVGVTTRKMTGRSPDAPGERGTLVRRYLMIISGYSWGESRASGSVSGEALLVSETFTAEDAVLPPHQPAVRPLFGVNYAGEQYIDTRLPWVREMEGRLLIDTEIAERHGVLVEELADGTVRVAQ